MTWTRLDDQWCDGEEVNELSLPARWHYLCLIQWCSRTKRYDGLLRLKDAQRCSDLEDTPALISELAEQGLVQWQGDRLKVVRIDEHIPPPSVRENSERSKVRMRRSRAHRNGDHSHCLPKNCEFAPAGNAAVEEVRAGSKSHVAHDVTRNTRTGQDRTGQALYNQVSNEIEPTVTAWEVAQIPNSEPGSVSGFGAVA